MKEQKDIEIIKAMAEAVAIFGTCAMEVAIWNEGAIAHLIPYEEEDIEEEDEY